MAENNIDIAKREFFDRYVEECHRNSREKGFWDKERNVGEALMLIVTELGEACEAHRTNNMGLFKKDTFEDEIADTFIRLFDLCGGWKIDVERQIRWKLAFNKKRPRLHGKEY